MAKKNNRKVVKMPLDIFDSLTREFPSCSNPERIRMIYQSHIEMKEMKHKMAKVGTFIYGKNNWESRYGKKKA